MNVAIMNRVRPALGHKLLVASAAGKEEVVVSVEELGNVLSTLKREDETQAVIGICTKPRFQGGRANMGVNRAVNRVGGHVDDVRKVARFTCGLGVWKNWVDNKGKRELGEKPDYDPLPPKGVEYIGRSPLMRGVKDPNKRYVCVQPTAFHVETEYRMLDGTPLPDLSAELYRAPGKSRVERVVGVKAPPIRTILLPSVEYLRLNTMKGENGQFAKIGLTLLVE